MLYKSAKPEGTPPTQEDMIRVGKFVKASMKSGTLITTEGSLPSAMGAHITLTAGKFNVVDGPFTESKELIGGFALIEAKSKEEALKSTKTFLNVAGDGETEIRQIFEAPGDFLAA